METRKDGLILIAKVYIGCVITMACLTTGAGLIDGRTPKEALQLTAAAYPWVVGLPLVCTPWIVGNMD